VYDAAMRYRDNARELLDPTLRRNGNGARPAAVVAGASSASVTDVTATEVRQLVAKSLGVSEDAILATTSLRDLGVNSLDLVVLVMAIEERFRIEFDPADLDRLRTFGDLALRVAALRSE
jgi:acyl carrier protein